MISNEKDNTDSVLVGALYSEFRRSGALSAGLILNPNNQGSAGDTACRLNNGELRSPPAPPEGEELTVYQQCLGPNPSAHRIQQCAEYIGEDDEDPWNESDRDNDYEDCYDDPNCDEEDSYGGTVRTHTSICDPINGSFEHCEMP